MGSAEGVNTKAKHINHEAYGFPSAKKNIQDRYLGMADLPQPEFVLFSCEEPLFLGSFSGYLLV